ncbi:MAG: hypothetical protein JXP39_01120, partial [Spirochaetales bacterium]|nr:hypothetical protein [Spirochaetales bacterium]
MKNTLFSRYMTAVVVLFLAAQTGAWGAIFTWNGGNGSWETPGNWTLTSGTDDGLDGIPNGGDAARIASAVTVTTPAAGVSVLGLTITAGATLTLGGNLAVTGETWVADQAFYLESTGITINLGGNDITAGKTHFGLNNQCGLTVNGAGNFTTNSADTNEDTVNIVALYTDANLIITTEAYLDHATGSMLFTGDSSSSLDLPEDFLGTPPSNVTIENIQILIGGDPFTITVTPELTAGNPSTITINGTFPDTQEFFFTATVTDANLANNESYTINGTSYNASVTAKTTLGTPTAGSPDTFSRNVTIPGTVDAGDGIAITFYLLLSGEYIPIGSIQYVQAGKEWIGGGGTSFWATDANWDPPTAPTGTDIVTIPSGATPIIQTGTTAIAKSVTVQTGATLTFESGSTLTADKIINNGTVELYGNETLPFTKGNGTNSTIIYTGTGTPRWGSTYENLTINASGTITAASALVVNKNLTLTAGTLAMTSNGTSVKGNIVKTNGIITSSGTIILDGTTAQNANLADGTNDSQIMNLTINNALGVTLTNTDAFIWNGDCDITAGTLTLANVSSQTIGGSATIEGTLNLGSDITVTGDIIIEATGRLNTGNNNLSAANITESGAGAVLNASGQ